jgi:alanine racemase
VIELPDLLEAMAPAGARLVGPARATRFDGFAYDSRKLHPGEIFLAVRTARADGHDFIADAIGHGAAGVIGDRVDRIGPFPVTTISVADTALALRAWARAVLDHYHPEVIAILGSVGKTTAAKAVVAVLGHGLPEDPTVFDSDNHNTLYGLPIALGRLAPTHQVAVLELARDAPGDLLALQELVRPRLAVVVRAFDDPAAESELAEVVAHLPPDGMLILNADDPRLDRLGARATVPVLRYGRVPSTDVRAEDIAYALDATRFSLRAGGAAVPVRLNWLGEPAVAGALAGAAVGTALGYAPGEVAAGLRRLPPLPGRLRPLAGLGGSLLLDDSFEAGPLAVQAGLDLLDRAAGPDDGRVEAQRAAGALAARRSDLLVTLGPDAEAAGLVALGGADRRAGVVVTDTAADAVDAVRPSLGPGDVVLVAGNAESRLEGVVERLLADPEQAPEVLVRQDAGWKRRVFLSRERPTWVEVDLAAIGHNVARLKAIAHPALLLAVLKADGYGHGAVRVARTALLHGADYLATACLSEALDLRRHGVFAPILILGYTPPWQAQEIIRHDLTATVFSPEPLRHLSRAAQSLGKGPAKVHVEVDTGMRRLGLLPPDVPAFLELARSLPGIEVEGIFTHFASADGADPGPTLAQIDRFEAVLTAIRACGPEPRYVHAANSAATLRFPRARYGMVRCGIAMYGLDPSEVVPCPPDFRAALTFKTLVAQVKDLPAGSPISYGGTFVTARPSRIAVLPVGYGDGFRRSPRNWGDVLIRGRRAPIVGVVCMDMCMIDVTDVPGARDGDEVVLIGRQGADQITVADVACRLGTIPYEVITQILARVPREVPPGA